MRRPDAPTAEAGFGLLEMLVSTALTALIFGALATMMGSLQYTYADLSGRIGAQQSARIALHRIQDDLALAGVGLIPIAPVVPALIPTGSDELEIRHNSSGVRSPLRNNKGTGLRLPVESIVGFAPGDLVLVYDDTGDFEIQEVAAVNVGRRRLRLTTAMARAYRKSEAAVAVRLERIIYRLDTTGATPTLTRQEGTDPALPIATDVDQFLLVYFDDSSPPVTFTPTTAAQQTRIRAVNVRLAVRTAQERLQGNGRPSLSFAARTTPRALSWRAS